MKALVVYDSVYGNTEKIAQAIGGALGPQAEVQVVRVGDAKPDHMVGLDLVVAGAPTHGSMPSPAMKAWLQALASNSLQGIKAAAFDTRVAVSDIKPAVAAFFVKLFGYAAPQIAGSLTKHGGTLVVPAEGFLVKDTQGPLKEGEIERAVAWARQIVARM